MMCVYFVARLFRIRLNDTGVIPRYDANQSVVLKGPSRNIFRWASSPQYGRASLQDPDQARLSPQKIQGCGGHSELVANPGIFLLLTTF